MRPYGAMLCLCFLAACGPRDPADARFKGTWKHIVENGLTNAKDESLVTVTADGDRFRLAEKAGDTEAIEVFDGHTLYTQYAGPFSVPPNEGTSTSTVSAEPMTVTQTGSRRFWSSTFRAGHAEPGGMIAGQATLLYRAGDRRPDGDISEEQWVDAKTGVLLKSIATIYSSQVRSIVRQETRECQSIDYADINESDFLKP